MKRLGIAILAITVSLVFAAGIASAAPDVCGNVFSGTADNFCGVITAVSSAGDGGGITIYVEGVGDVLVNGLGPMSLWIEAGVARPKVGDEVCVSVMTVLAKNILISLTYADGTSISVRDSGTGCPLWWKEEMKGNMNGKMKGRNK
jgi:hypothetical protein